MPDYQLDGRKGCKVTEDGGLAKVFVEEGTQQVIAVVAAYPILVADHGAIYTNAGATGAASLRQLTLPAPSNGLAFAFYEQDGVGIRVLAPGGSSIRLAPGEQSISKAGGYIESQFQGQFIRLRCVNAIWVAESPVLDWTVEYA